MPRQFANWLAMTRETGEAPLEGRLPGVHKNVAICFHLRHDLFKSGRYCIDRKAVASRESLPFRKEILFSTSLLFYSLSRKTPLLFSSGVFPRTERKIPA